jgi:trehalose 6-phosphate synthase
MLTPMLQSDDLVWVQDYHFIALGARLRARGVTTQIGFFLHIPFPPPDVLVAIPEHEWLLKGLFEYDLVGFQTKTDLGNFCRFACDFMDGEMIAPDVLRMAGKILSVAVLPVGIDVDAFAAMARTREASTRILRLHRAGEPRINIIGVDRLDYTKGLPDRLRSFRRLLEIYPQNRKAVTLMQIAPPTREEVRAYADIRHELEALSGEINGEFGDFDWTPVRYIHRRVARDARRPVSRQPGRVGHALARRHESRRQGVCRRPR